jgi:hypothetical protein
MDWRNASVHSKMFFPGVAVVKREANPSFKPDQESGFSAILTSSPLISSGICSRFSPIQGPKLQ